MSAKISDAKTIAEALMEAEIHIGENGMPTGELMCLSVDEKIVIIAPHLKEKCPLCGSSKNCWGFDITLDHTATIDRQSAQIQQLREAGRELLSHLDDWNLQDARGKSTILKAGDKFDDALRAVLAESKEGNV